MRLPFAAVCLCFVLCCGSSESCALSCHGCCDTNLGCHAGTADDQCGLHGALCVACSASMMCNGSGQCQFKPGSACTPSTCAGCCDQNQTCQAGNTAQACGSGGALCGSCASPKTCNGVVCN